MLAGEPSHVKAWQRGAAGEEHTARELERRLAGSDVVFLHDRSLPGRRANVDHIAIGPRGVTVIESKHVRGEVRAAGGGQFSGPPRLLVDKRDRTAWIEAVLDQGRAVWSVLAAAGFADLPLYGCICPDPSGLPPLGTIEIDGVRVPAPPPRQAPRRRRPAERDPDRLGAAASGAGAPQAGRRRARRLRWPG
ncbi:MAG: nuclease-related domain-containing protein [Solirubrobacteraceae bacterium]